MVSQNELLDLQETLYASKNATRRWLHCSRRDWVVAALRRSAALHGGRALEVGPGSGIYLPLLAALFDHAVASDVEPVYLAHAAHLSKQHPNLSFTVDDITSSSLDADSFDLILCTEVIEHIADSRAALQGMHKILKRDGTLILTTPQRYSPLELAAKVAFLPGVIQLVRAVYREPILRTGHINLMTADEVVAQLCGVGFSIHEQYKSGLYLPLIAEFLGETGLRCEMWLENRMRNTNFDRFLWTQCYVAKA